VRKPKTKISLTSGRRGGEKNPKRSQYKYNIKTYTSNPSLLSSQSYKPNINKRVGP
jgi:hypothetical protein